MVNKNVLIIALVLVIVVLAGIVVYAFAIKPAYTGYVANKQVEGYNVCVANLLTQLQQNGFVQVNLGNGTLYLAPFNPQQQEAQ